MSFVNDMLTTRKKEIGSRIFMLLIGLFSASNAIYVFKISNVLIYPIYLIAILAGVFSFFLNRDNRKKSFHIPTELILFFAFSLLSILTTIILHPGFLIQWFAGIVVLLFYVLLILVILANSKQIDYLFYGIIIGIFLNALVCGLQFFFFLRGEIFSLSIYFPDANIYRPNLWNNYYAIGLFREQGHLMRYLAIFALPTLSFARKKSKILFLFSLAIIFVQMAMTASATLALFAIGCLVYAFLNLRIDFLKTTKAIAIFATLFFALLVISYSISPTQKMIQSIIRGLSDFSLTDSNGVRISGITKGFDVLIDYPVFGTGYNTITKIFVERGYYGVDNVTGTYSAGLSLMVEVGIGSLAFFYFVLSKAYKLSFSKNKMCIAFGASLVIYFLLFFLTDYSFDPGTSVFIGMCLIFLQKNNLSSVKKGSNNSHFSCCVRQ